MSEQRSPWAQPDTEVVVAPVQGTATVDRPVTVRPGSQPLRTPNSLSRLKPPPPPVFLPPPGRGGGGDEDPVQRNRRVLKWLGGGAVGVIVVGLIVSISLVLTGHTNPDGLLHRMASGPSDTRPELAKRCPPPSNIADAPSAPAPAAPPGPRISDPDAGISYAEYGSPWELWDAQWTDAGELKVTYAVGEHFVTEPNYDGAGDDYQATILSGHVPAAVNDGLALDLDCIGHQVAADVRITFYPKNNSMTTLKDQAATLGGRPAWVLKFHLSFSEPGLRAKGELVSIALIDVGRPDAAILYVSIPDTHTQYDYVADDALNSVRPV